MKAINYFKLDNKINKMSQIIWIIVFWYGLFMFDKDIILILLAYTKSAAMILQGMIFIYEQKRNVGFINMLPGNDKDRVMGRYMSGVVFIATSTIIDFIILIINYIKEKETVDISINLIIMGFGCGLILMAIYSNLLYIAGKEKNRLRSILFISPLLLIWTMAPMVIFFEIDERKGAINPLAGFVKENITMVTIVVVAIGILFYWLSMHMAVKIVKNKDFV